MSNDCKSCGAVLHGRFCSACGEKSLMPDDHSIRHYLGSLVNAFTFVDSKFWHTLKAVAVRPGELSAAYMDGRRTRYMRPVAFFFLANFLYFLAPVFETFTLTLYAHMNLMPYSDWAAVQVNDHLTSSGTSLDVFEARYRTASSNNAKLLLVFVVFMLSLPLGLLYIGKRSYFSAYVTAAFELMAFYLWVCTLALGLAFAALVMALEHLGTPASHLMQDAYTIGPLLALHFWATISIGRRFFGCSWPGAIWRSLALMFGVIFAITSYRLLLFLVTFWQLT